MAIFPLYYFPPVTWFAAASRFGKVTLEVCEHYHKQEYFNRMRIPGPNKLLVLSVPVLRQGERVPLNASRISYEQNWQQLHWKSIESAYRSSPYFEYYEDRLASIFEQNYDRLAELNLAVLSMLRDILLPGLEWDFTSEFFDPGHYEDDFRRDFDPTGKKLPTWFKPQPWTQVFGTQEADPSALDLVCNYGPEARTFLRQLV